MVIFLRNILKDYAATENNPKWENIIKRENSLYARNNEIRDEFERDYTRIIHSTAYRRMKHKTQVFFSPSNDHVCTRMEHVTLVESISHTIAKYLGLNVDLTKAIAIGHDLGHSPFGHQGEKILSEITMRDLGKKFWHEKNGLEMVDKIEVLNDYEDKKRNLNLTYGVRDGIISHCGEIDEKCIRPREEFINLEEYLKPNQFAPYTWEACVVKVADKISYLGRDIEDAITHGILDEQLEQLYEILKIDKSESVINNTVIINDLVYDLCENSSFEKGLCFSDRVFELVNKIKEFNYRNIYLSDRLKPSNDYFKLVINTIYDTLKKSFREKEKIRRMYPKVYGDFEKWLACYWNGERCCNLKNDVIFDMGSEKDYCQAIVYYISGMTDNFAVDVFEEIVGF